MESTKHEFEFKDFKNEYLQNISEKELKAYHIAKDHLGESFQLEKSTGFLEWVKKTIQNQPSLCK